MHIPPMTKSLAARIEYGDINYFIARIKTLQSIENNPFNAQIRQFGSAVAFQVGGTKHPIFNRVMGASDDTIQYLNEILEWYHAADRVCRFDIVPSSASERLMSALSRRGLYQTGFYAALYAAPEYDNSLTYPPDIKVERLPSGDRELMLDVYAAGFNFPAKIQPVMRQSLRGLFDAPNVRFAGANISDKLVGVGILFILDSVGYIASTTTLPAYRGRGCQHAILQYAVGEAGLEQCDLVVAHCAFASITQRNLERHGLRLGYTKAIWVEQKKES